MKINVPHIAKLANLPITKAEEKMLEKQLSETLAYVAILDEIDTKKVIPTSQVTGLENVTREDIAAPSLTQAEALNNTQETHNGSFKVKAILDSDN
jgi:aspartyl/glutamyl-tRNA(Asn/Gln) amidotransferase C subunit